MLSIALTPAPPNRISKSAGNVGLVTKEGVGELRSDLVFLLPGERELSVERTVP